MPQLFYSYTNNYAERYWFGFNGFAKENEIYGEANFISWGDFGYDSRIGRRWNLDPLYLKFPWQSPYSCVGNNPIIHKELDGNDYTIYVNHDNKTIIFTATIYTIKNDQEAFYEANHIKNYYESQNGKFVYEVEVNGEKQTYEVSFDIKILPLEGDLNVEMQKDRAKFYPTNKKHTPDKSSNILYVVSDESMPKNTISSPSGSIGTSEHGGQNENGRIMKIPKQHLGKSIGPHEKGHGFGMQHRKGLMNWQSNNSYRLRRKNLQDSFNNALNKTEAAVGEVITTGDDEPNNFSSGKFKKN